MSTILGGWLRWRLQGMSPQFQEEEETLTSFEPQLEEFELTEEITMTPQPLENGYNLRLPSDPRLMGWEFKIVRANRNLFRNPDIFQQLCEEESQTGWILLEKLDDGRVRFKRPIALRYMINPDEVSYDPYRCYYKTSSSSLNWLAAIAAIVTLLLPAYLGYAYVSNLLTHSPLRANPHTLGTPPHP